MQEIIFGSCKTGYGKATSILGKNKYTVFLKNWSSNNRVKMVIVTRVSWIAKNSYMWNYLFLYIYNVSRNIVLKHNMRILIYHWSNRTRSIHLVLLMRFLFSTFSRSDQSKIQNDNWSVRFLSFYDRIVL